MRIKHAQVLMQQKNIRTFNVKKMSIISNSFKKNAAQKLVKSMGVDEKTGEYVTEAWIKGFELAEAMFTEQV